MSYVIAIAAALLVAAVVAIVLLYRRVQRLKAEVRETEQYAERRVANMREQCQEEMGELADRHSSELAEMRLRHERELQDLREHIESDRAVLLRKNDKDLLVDVVLALEGYGGRIARLEQSLDQGRVSARIDEMSSAVSERINSMAITLEGEVKALRESASQSMSELDVSQVMQKLVSLDAAIGTANQSVIAVSEKVDVINGRTRDYDSSVEELCSLLKGLDSVSYTISSISSEVSDIRSSVGNNRWGNSLHSSIDDIELMLGGIESAANDAKSAAESAQSAIESVVSGL